MKQLMAAISLGALIVGFGGAARAQALQAPAVEAVGDDAILNITVEGRSERRPDLASLSAGVVTHGRTAAEALGENTARMTAVLAALKRLGVGDRDLQTSTVTLQPQYHYPQPPPPVRRPDGTVQAEAAEPSAPRIIGYEARNTVSIKVRRLSDVGGAIDALVASGANQVDGPYFSLDRPEQAIDEARASAMRAAQARADLYVRTGGFRRARMVSVTEGGGYYPVAPQVVVTGARGSAAGAPPPPPPPPPAPVQPGELNIGVSLSVQFVLEK